MTVRVVLDTNVVVSALLKPQALEDQVLRLALVGQFQLYVSPALLTEYATVLSRPKLQLRPNEINRTLEGLREAGWMVQPTRTLSECPHEPDNRFLECAEAARADYLVTGNKRHFPARWKTTKIVNARELLSTFEPTIK